MDVFDNANMALSKLSQGMTGSTTLLCTANCRGLVVDAIVCLVGSRTTTSSQLNVSSLVLVWWHKESPSELSQYCHRPVTKPWPLCSGSSCRIAHCVSSSKSI